MPPRDALGSVPVTPRKDMGAVLAEARRQGWRVEKTRNGHWALYAPNGSDIVHVSGTPRDASAVTKVVTKMRKYGFEWKGR